MCVNPLPTFFAAPKKAIDTVAVVLVEIIRESTHTHAHTTQLSKVMLAHWHKIFQQVSPNADLARNLKYFPWSSVQVVLSKCVLQGAGVASSEIL